MRFPRVGIFRAALALSAVLLLTLGVGTSDAADRSVKNRALKAGSASDRRIALVVGNANYRNQPLRNPVNDARGMARTLKFLGFEVVYLQNGTKAKMQDAILKFAELLADGGTGLFYYAGHGVQVRGTNYLVPIDERIRSEASVRFESISLDAVIEQMGQPRPNRTNIVILDACRNNPFGSRYGGSGAGLALVDAPTDFLIAYATAPGSVAVDGDGVNGLYTDSLLKSIRAPGLRIEDVFKRVRAAVSAKTGHTQIPWEASSLVRDFTFNARTTKKKTATQTAAMDRVQVERMVRGARESVALEMAFWDAIKDSTSPEDYAAYLEAYPKGKFAPLAKVRANRYRKRTAARPQAPPAVSPRPAPVKAAPPPPKVVTAPAPAPTVVAPRPTPTKKSAPKKPPKKVAAAPAPTPVAPKPVAKAPSKPAPKMVAKAAPTVAPSPPQRKRKETQIAVGTFPKAPKGDGKSFRDCADCPELVAIPAGPFIMGTSRGDAAERPAHRVRITRRFAIGKYPVTVGEWNSCVSERGCKYRPSLKGAGDRAPVRNINWKDAQQYVAWLSKKTGKRYRLPSEAEWEYAARGGTTTRFWWGDRLGRNNANCRDCGGSYNRKAPPDVGRYRANPFGLHDVNGGVWEWVGDCWYGSHAGAPSDGAARSKRNCSRHTLRGGAWRSKSSGITSTSRFYYDTGVRYYTNGLRVARSMN